MFYVKIKYCCNVTKFKKMILLNGIIFNKFNPYNNKTTGANNGKS